MGKLKCCKTLKAIDSKYIESAVKLFIGLSRGFETRSKTWDDCHKCFEDIHGRLKKSGYSRTLSKDEKEIARLYLMNYLASWGMYRGSSFVLQYDANIYDDVIKAIFDKNYDSLWDISYDCLEKNVNNERMLIKKLIDKIDGILSVQRNFTYFEKIEWTGNKTSGKVSKTLITKILLGTICCMPALDTNFNAIVGHTDKPLDETYLQFLFEMILKKGNSDDFDLKNNKNDYVFKELSKTYPEIPLMKIVDMAFFTIGDEKKFKELFEKYILNGEVPNNNKKWNEWVKLIKHFYYKINPNEKCTLNVAFDYMYMKNAKSVEVFKELGCENPTKKDDNNDIKDDILDLNKKMEKYIDKYKPNINLALERIRKK